jgi:hypothetical protein
LRKSEKSLCFLRAVEVSDFELELPDSSADMMKSDSGSGVRDFPFGLLLMASVDAEVEGLDILSVANQR